MCDRANTAWCSLEKSKQKNMGVYSYNSLSFRFSLYLIKIHNKILE